MVCALFALSGGTWQIVTRSPSGAVPHVQTPVWHVWPSLQASVSSSQGRPSLIVALDVSQLPSAPTVSHVLSALHWSPVPEQSTAVPPVQEPTWHVSPSLQASVSSQGNPSLIVTPAVSQLPSAPAGTDIGDQRVAYAVAGEPATAAVALRERHIGENDDLGALRQRAQGLGGTLDRSEDIDVFDEEGFDQAADFRAFERVVGVPTPDVAAEPVRFPSEIEIAAGEKVFETGHEMHQDLVGIADDERPVAPNRHRGDLARDVVVEFRLAHTLSPENPDNARLTRDCRRAVTCAAIGRQPSFRACPEGGNTL